MLFHKWNWDEALEVRFEEGITKGEAKGVAIGEARGVAIGEARGVKKGLLQTARTMKAKGFNTAVIAEITGLSEKEINALSGNRLRHR